MNDLTSFIFCDRNSQWHDGKSNNGRYVDTDEAKQRMKKD